MPVLVVGTGPTGLAHLDALLASGCGDVAAWAPSDRSKQQLDSRDTPLLRGSLASVLDTFRPDRVVVATPVDTLKEVARQVMEADVPNVLVEKPGALFQHDADELASLAQRFSTNAFIAMNRRFLPSVIAALGWLSVQGAKVISGFFDFSETRAVLQRLGSRPAVVRDRWLVANAIHVIDTAFLPSGLPVLVQANCSTSQVASRERLPVFAGFTTGRGGTHFSYHSIWGSGSRWRIEWHTNEGSLFLEPLETVKLATVTSPFERRSLHIEKSDPALKPGFLGQARAFLGGPGRERLMRIEELPHLIETIDRIACTEIGQSGVR